MPKTNRKRSKAVTIRLTPEEYRIWESTFSRSHTRNQSDFLVKLLTEKDIMVLEDFRPLLAELKQQGGNLNQLVRRVNCGESNGNAVIVVLKNCNATYRAVYDTAKKLGVI